MDHQLDLVAGLNALDGELGNGLLRHPDDLAGLLLVVLVGVEVGVIVFLGLGRLLLLGLRLGLGDLDVTGTLNDADEDVATFLRSGVLGNAASGESSLSLQESLELGGLAGGKFNAKGVLEVGSGSDHRVNRLLDVLLLELLDQRGLDGGTSGGQLGGVDSASKRRGGKNVGLLGEDVAGQLGNLWGVRGTAGEDNLNSLSENYSCVSYGNQWQLTYLVDIQNIQASLLDDLLDQASELSEDLAG